MITMKTKRFLPFLLTSVLCLLISVPALRAADISITATSVVMSSNGLYKTAPCGISQTVTAGKSVYLDPLTNTIKLADADAMGSAVITNAGGGGIALNGGSAGQPITYCYYDSDFTLGGTIASGAIAMVSLNPGGITATVADITSGAKMIVLGVGNGTANHIILNPTQGGAVP